MTDTISDRQRFWRNHLQACAASGRSMKAYAAEQGLNCGSLYSWKRRLKVRDDRAEGAVPVAPWLPVQVVGSGSPQTGHCRITLPNTVAIDWPVVAEPERLRDLLRVLAEAA